jgi:hypothetical protein
LNEINFDVVKKYIEIQPENYPNLKKLFNYKNIKTTCEKDYENLEPWIQWASVHTCMSFKEHGVFRLGDMVGSKAPQIFERLEKAGYKVGAISAMNAENRLEKPAFFIPDPWTQTNPDNSWWSKVLSQAVSQAVNDNAQSKITLKSKLHIILGLIKFARFSNYAKYLKLIALSRSRPWTKALVLDLLLHDIHWSLFNKTRPNFSTLFLNAGAHIQHHYFYNAEPLRKELSNKNPDWYLKDEFDPLADVLSIYDAIVGDYFSRKDTELLLATGLAQKPYDRVKFYYRLNSHSEFLKKIGIEFCAVYPRMTRDFLIEFNDENSAKIAQNKLSSILITGTQIPLFDEIDNRGGSLFVTLTYPHEISLSTSFSLNGVESRLLPEVSFVAIKNGMHQEEGFAFFSPGMAKYIPEDRSHVKSLGMSVMNYFAN